MNAPAQILLFDFFGAANSLLLGWGVSEDMVHLLSSALLITGLCVILWIVYVVLSRLVEPVISRITRYTDAKWDDVVFRHNVLKWVWLLVVAILAYTILPSTLDAYPDARSVVEVILRLALITCLMMITIEGVRSLFLVLGESSHSLKGLQQMLCVIIAGIGIILMISTVLGRDPLIIFSGLGAMAAVLLLIFQDSILGVVAGVQITVNNMLRIGDWIIANKYGANGIVEDITLAAVKVRNWDHSIVTIPPYHLITEGFQNWRGMIETEGRRVTRAINIDMSYVRVLTDDEIARFSAEEWWQESVAPGRPVNLTAFRMWLLHYITTVPTMVSDMLFMVRELTPTPDGLPVEMYFFTKETYWPRFERVQADVYDHVLASVHDFGLRVFQHWTNR